MSSAIAASIADLFGALSAHRRILQVHFPATAPAAVKRLVAFQVEGDEAVCGSVRYRLQCIGDDCHLPLSDLIGLPLGLSVRDDQGGERVVCGIVSRAEHVFADAAGVVLEVELRDALSHMAKRRTFRLWNDKSVVDIIEDILKDHQQNNQIFGAAFQFSVEGLRKSYPPRAFTMQYGQDDMAFIFQLAAQEGIGHFWRFSLEGHGADRKPVHTLVLADHAGAYTDSPAGAVKFQRADSTEPRDTVVHWRAWREHSVGEIARSTWDYKPVKNLDANTPTVMAQGEAGDALARTLTDYQYDPARFGAGAAHFEQMSRSRMLAHEYAAKGWYGEGVVRQFGAGTAFSLNGHPEIDAHEDKDRRFILTRLQAYARNNLRLDARLSQSLFTGWSSVRPPSETDGQGDGKADGTGAMSDAPVYYNRFECVRDAITPTPMYDPEKWPVVHALSAIVVGHAGSEIDVDELGRVAVRFPFTRPQEHPTTGATDTARDSARIRVLHPWADAGFGFANWPRVNSEALVMFIGGDPSKPVILGGLYDGTHATPQFNGLGSLPANAALTGIRTKELQGERHNQLRFDDSPAQVSTQLLSEHQATQLNQGWIGTPRNEGKSDPRGEGFEQATNAAGAIRAARGLLVSAFARLNASGHQLAREETLAVMEETLALFKQLGQYAASHEGLAVETQPHEKTQQQLKDWENGSNTAPGAAGGGAPMLVATAPAGVLLSSPETVIAHAGKVVDLVALQHIQLSSGERLVANAGKGLSLFVQSEDCRIIANQGKVRIQSQKDDTVIQSAKDINISASGGKVHVIAADQILLVTSDGTYLKLGGGNFDAGCKGQAFIRAAGHQWTGPATEQGELPKFSTGDVGRTPALMRPTDGEAMQGVSYQALRSDGSVSEGVTDAAGKATNIVADSFEHLTIKFLSPKS